MLCSLAVLQNFQVILQQLEKTQQAQQNLPKRGEYKCASEKQQSPVQYSVFALTKQRLYYGSVSVIIIDIL